MSTSRSKGNLSHGAMFAAARTLLFGGAASKALGVAREVLTAALFGTGAIAVAYRLAQAAFLIPLHGFFSETFNAGFTPAYARSRRNHAERSRVLFAAMHAVVLVVSLCVGALLALVASRWVGLLAPGFDAPTAAMASQMVAVLALAMPCYALTGLYAAAEIAAGDARMAAARAAAQNIGLIAGTALAWQLDSPVYIAVGFLAAYAALASWGFWRTMTNGLRPWPRLGEWALAREELHTVWRAVRLLLLVPVLLQVHFVIERRVASLVSDGAVAALDYARFLSDTAVLLLAVPFGLAGLGAMATMSDARFRAAARRAMGMLVYAGLPLSVAAAVHGETIVRAVFARGAFDGESVAATAAILQWLALGLWAQLVGYAGAKFLSARNGNARLIGVYAAAVICNVGLNLALYPIFGEAALGISAAAYGLVFGVLALKCLGLLGTLARDVATAGLLAAAYAAAWALAPADVAQHAWFPVATFTLYWAAAAALVPRYRAVVQQAWWSFRAA
jgi:putative peptidoglycan lipid II flippase